MILKYQNIKISLFLVIAFCIGTQSAIGATMRCERYLVAGENKLTGGMRAFNQNYPEVLIINQTVLNKFEKLPNRPVIRYSQKVKFRGSQATGVRYIYFQKNCA